jgi:peptide/nickel transport system substrate-binding protein
MPTMPSGSTVLVLLLAALAGAGPAPEPAATQPGDTPPLFEPMPVDRKGVDTSATLHRRLKAEPTSLNPLLMFTAVDAEFDYLLWDRPFVLDDKLQWRLNPAVAERYVESEDHTFATLTLRAELTWHDGAPLTADDFVFSWRRLMDERGVFRRARTGPDQLAAVEADGPRRVRFRFRQPLPTNKWNVNFPIIPRHLYEGPAESDPTLAQSEANVALNRHPVGNGPYRLVEWVAGERLVLERWENYRGRKPAFARVVMRVIPDPQTALLAFEAGEIDELELTPQQYARETDGERFRAIGVKAAAPQWTNYYLGWNVSGASPFLADVKVRQALGHALNTSLINERVFFGLFQPSPGVFHPDSWVGDTQLTPYLFNRRVAAELLEEAGWARDPADGWRYKDIDGARRRAGFTLNIVQGSQTSPQIADLYQADLRKIGVELTTQTLEWTIFNERNFKHEFEAYLSAWTAGPEPDDAWNLFHSSAIRDGRNYSGYANADVDELLETARRSLDDDARRTAYRRIAEIIHEEAPYTFIASAQTLWAFNRRIRGVTFSPRGPLAFFPGMNAWWKPDGSP